MKPLSELCEAVKDLRVAVGMTQQQFATDLGLAMTSIARYETGREPTGRALWVLYQLAEHRGLTTLRNVFQSRLLNDIGANMFWTMHSAMILIATARKDCITGNHEQCQTSLNEAQLLLKRIHPDYK